MKRSVVYTYDDVYLADLALNHLKRDGVQAIIEKKVKHDEHLTSRVDYQLLVPMYDIERTIIVLDYLDNL